MADDDAASEQFTSSIAAIKRCFDAEEFDSALSHCAKVVELRPDCVEGRACRIFAFLSLSRWAEALKTCDTHPGDAEAFAFERAYCLYRLNRFQEALEVMKSSAVKDDPRSDRLVAQIRYRMGDYEACAKMYEKLFDDDSEDVGLLVNALASRISAGQPGQARGLTSDRDDLLESSYELSFNLSCALIDEGRYGDAETRLEEAKQVCLKELMVAEEVPEEDASLLEDHEELAAIQVQRGVVLQRRGDVDEAQKLYSSVLRQRARDAGEVDVTVLAVACNNVVALRTERKSLFDSLKRINIASKESLEHKLTRRQTIEIALNKVLLLIQAHKLDEARREVQRLKEEHPGHPRVAVVQAAIAHSEKKTKVCEELLQDYLKDKPGSEDVLVSLAQLYAQQNKPEKAAEALTQLPVQRRSQPQTLQGIVALHQRQKNPAKAVACLREAIEYWSSQENADEDTFASVLRIAARLALQLKDDGFAAEVYENYLEKVDGHDVEALCGLVQSLAVSDVARAEQFAMRLRVPAYDHLDAEELEQAAIPNIAQQLKKKVETEKATKASAAEAEAEGEPAEGEEGGDADKGEEKEKEKAKTKKHKIRYPKNFDPENPGPPPDPERWLPKRERTEFKKRMSRKSKGLLRGPQGSMPTDDNAFRKQGPSTAQVEVSTDAGKRGPARGAQRPKKGKK